MKKISVIIICMIFCILTACSIQSGAVGNNLNPSENIDMFEEKGKYFHIYSGNAEKAGQIKYDIFNTNGEIVFSDTTDRPLRINMINDDIVDIAIGMGTGLTVHRYYNSKENLFSEDFVYVIASINELVVYIRVSAEPAMENRTVVVQNMFDESLYFKEYKLDFSNTDTPVINAEFSSDETSLKVTYLTGEEQVEKTEILYLEP